MMSVIRDIRTSLMHTMEASDPKIVLLVMSCNDPVLKTCTEMLNFTLGNEAIEHGVKYLTYIGGCDKQAIVDDCIHCVSGDDLDNTFIKTQEALKIVKDEFDPDFIIRINTSTYVNLELAINFIRSEIMNSNKLIYNGEISDLNGRIQLRGNSFIFGREMIDKIIEFDISDCPSDLENLHDDVVISYIVQRILGEDKTTEEIIRSEKIGVVPMVYMNDLARLGHPMSVIDKRLVSEKVRDKLPLYNEDEITNIIRANMFISYRKNYVTDRYQEIGECLKIRDVLKGFVTTEIPECLKEIDVWNYRERRFEKIQI